MIINEKSVTLYEYAGCGGFKNPLVGVPSISAQIWNVHDKTDGEKTVTEFVNVSRSVEIPYSPTEVIDPASIGIEDVPPISQAIFYAYMKTLLMNAMMKPTGRIVR